jgi:hypothetical protein
LKIFMSTKIVLRYVVKVKLIISHFCWPETIFLSNESPRSTQQKAKDYKKSDLDKKDKKLNSHQIWTNFLEPIS